MAHPKKVVWEESANLGHPNGYLGGGGLVSSNEAGHLEVISVCVGALEVLGALGALSLIHI